MESKRSTRRKSWLAPRPAGRSLDGLGCLDRWLGFRTEGWQCSEVSTSNVDTGSGDRRTTHFPGLGNVEELGNLGSSLGRVFTVMLRSAATDRDPKDESEKRRTWREAPKPSFSKAVQTTYWSIPVWWADQTGKAWAKAGMFPIQPFTTASSSKKRTVP